MENYQINISQIPVNLNYEGYTWWSNSQKPIVYIANETLPNWPVNTDNPFIVEGNLFDKINQLSYSIKYIDGDYLVMRFDLNELKDSDFILKSYLPNRFPNEIQSLCFKEFWKAMPDEFCNDMQVLKPAETVFVGFNFKEE